MTVQKKTLGSGPRTFKVFGAAVAGFQFPEERISVNVKRAPSEGAQRGGWEPAGFIFCLETLGYFEQRVTMREKQSFLR